MDNQFYNTAEKTAEVTFGHYEPLGDPTILVFHQGDVTMPQDNNPADAVEGEFVGEDRGQG